MKRALAVTAVAAFSFGCAGTLAAAPSGSLASAAWALGTDTTNVFREHGSADLVGDASTATFQAGGEIVEHGADGNFEFEHGSAQPATLFEALTEGGTATPLQIGSADGQNVTALVTGVESGATADIESWGATTLDRYGRLHVNGIVLYSLQRRGRSVLAALLPNGTSQILQPAAP